MENQSSALVQNTEFQCSDCSEDFYMSNVRNESGLFQTFKKSQHEFVNCTKCHFLKSKQSDECPSCGVIETRYKDIIKLENPRLFELNKIWSTVVTDLENDQLHQSFLNLAQSMTALNFAAQKYLDLQKIMGVDELTEKYLNQIELRLEVVATNFISDEKNKKDSSFLARRSGKKKFLGIEYSFRNICLAVGFAGIFFFVINVMRPIFPSLNGLLVAMVVLSVALWAISKNQTKMF